MKDRFTLFEGKREVYETKPHLRLGCLRVYATEVPPDSHGNKTLSIYLADELSQVHPFRIDLYEADSGALLSFLLRAHEMAWGEVPLPATPAPKNEEPAK